MPLSSALRCCGILVGLGLGHAVQADVAKITELLEADETVEALNLLDLELQQSSPEMALREMRVDIRVGMGFGAGVVQQARRLRAERVLRRKGDTLPDPVERGPNRYRRRPTVLFARPPGCVL